jgi:cobalt/nickel transport system ATP-binding protein
MQIAQVVELAALSYTYPDGQHALVDVSLCIASGEKVGLVGDNGAGKSTLLLHLNGILRATDGQRDVAPVRVAGLELNDRTVRTIRARVGLVFQDPDDQLFSPTVYDDVAFGPLNMGLCDDEVRARVAWALEQVGGAEYAAPAFSGRMPHHLSLGEKKRVAIATVLAMQPEILALDEPSAGLDPKGRSALLALLKDLPQTMLIATHDLDLVRTLCTRVVVLERGRVIADGPVALLETSYR